MKEVRRRVAIGAGTKAKSEELVEEANFLCSDEQGSQLTPVQVQLNEPSNDFERISSWEGRKAHYSKP